MPIYKYEALTATGKRVSGEEASTSARSLREVLGDQGLLVTRLQRKYARRLSPGSRSIPLEELKLFNQEFIALLRAGLTIPAALAITADRPTELGGVLQQVLADVKNGTSLSLACGNHGDALPSSYIATLDIGERSGELIETLKRYESYLEQTISLNQQVSRAMIYPLFLLFTMAVILVVLFTFVMPRFANLYADFNAPLPAPTLALMHVVDHVLWYGLGLVAVGGGLWWLRRHLNENPAWRMRVAKGWSQLPIIGDFIQQLQVARTCRTLGILLASGVPLVKALEVAGRNTENLYYGDKLTAIAEDVKQGRSLSQAVVKTGFLPATATKLIEAGEASGNLDSMLTETAQYYEVRLDHGLGRIVSLVEPLLILLIGVFIGGIIIVMYLPIFSMSEIIQ